MPRCLAIVIVALGLVSPGCTNIRKMDDPRVVRAGGLDKLVFGDYWKVEELPVAATPRETTKVAIAEFTVEFVLEKTRYAPDTTGVSRRVMLYKKDLVAQLPDRLYDSFVERLRQRGKTVSTKEQVRTAKAHAQYPLRAAGAAQRTRFVTPEETDSGRIRTIFSVSTTGLDVIENPQDWKKEAADRALMKELGVDLILRARYRVGVHDGKATVEQGSMVAVTVADVSGRVVSTRSLASEKWVGEGGGNLPDSSGEYDIATGRYMQQVEPLFLSYMDLSLDTVARRK